MINPPIEMTVFQRRLKVIQVESFRCFISKLLYNFQKVSLLLAIINFIIKENHHMIQHLKGYIYSKYFKKS
jgi:hypothetical protein